MDVISLLSSECITPPLITGPEGLYNCSSQIHSKYAMFLQFLWKNKWLKYFKLVQFKLQVVAGSRWYDGVYVMVSRKWLVIVYGCWMVNQPMLWMTW